MNTNHRQRGDDRVTLNMNLNTNVLTANDAYMLIASDGQHSGRGRGSARARWRSVAAATAHLRSSSLGPMSSSPPPGFRLLTGFTTVPMLASDIASRPR